MRSNSYVQIIEFFKKFSAELNPFMLITSISKGLHITMVQRKWGMSAAKSWKCSQVFSP